MNYIYRVEASTNLVSWVDIGSYEPGTGGDVTLGFSLPSGNTRLFYRIKEFVDPLNGGFLSRPFNREEVDLTDGVCIAFQLDALPAIPARILIHQRPFQQGAPWELIGNITDITTFTDITTLNSVNTVRGSVVWLPEAPGEYEVQAVALTSTNAQLGTAVRLVSVGVNQAPVITINGPADGYNPPFILVGPSQLSVSVQDGDGDPVTRVEFFDNGLYVGTDTQPPFGDEIVHKHAGGSPIFWGGHHAITAVAYDRRGTAGSTAQPYLFEVINGPAAPTVSITSVQPGFVVQQGQPLTINVAAADADGELQSIVGFNTQRRFDWLAEDLEYPFNEIILDTQFGSEEYDEYVGQYDDGFLVAVDGAVVSLTPDCDDVISVNAINNAPGFIRRSHLCTRTPRIEDNNRRVEYDGTTVLLRSHVLVKPSARHRIRFAIADARDNIYDSGLFVRKGSVRSINPQP